MNIIIKNASKKATKLAYFTFYSKFSKSIESQLIKDYPSKKSKIKQEQRKGAEDQEIHT